MAFTFGSSNKPTTTFGTPASTSSTGGFSGFGTPASTSSTGGFSGFGTSASTPSTGLFGAPAPTTSSTGFSFGGFGSGAAFGAKTTASSTLGTGTTFGATAGTGFGTGLTTGFNAGTTTTGFGTSSGLTLGQQPTTGIGQSLTQGIQPALSPMVLMNLALSNPQIHGDERDGIIAKLNQLQAYWGAGSGYYNQQGAAIDFTPENPYCRFKVVGYSRLPSASNADGFVGIQIKKKEQEVHQQQQNLVSELQKCFGNKPSIMVCVDGLKPLPDDSTEVVFKVVERADNGTTKTYNADEVYAFLNQAHVKTQLQNMGVTNITAKTSMPPALLQQYLNTPPTGIDPLLWEQAKKDNPDPERLIPVPITGFSELKKRLKFQDQETSQHQKRLSIISEEIATLQCNHATTMAKLAQFKRRHLELSHRVLEVMVKQESIRKAGYSVQADEEQLRVHFESLQAELNAPLQFKARLNELLSQIRLQQSQGVGQDRGDGRYTMDPSLQNELRQHLAQQQDGLMHLITIIKEDVEDLKTIEQGLTESLVVR